MFSGVGLEFQHQTHQQNPILLDYISVAKNGQV